MTSRPSVNKGGTNQTVTLGAATLITWSTEVIDTNNNFGSNWFTPTVAGKYLVTGTVRCGSATGYCIPILSKSGATIAEGTAVSAAGVVAGTFSMVVDMNGSSDYLEVYVYNSGSTTVEGASVWTYFSGTLIASGNGQGGGGTATPAGSTADVQFNNAGPLAADTGLFTYASGVLKAPTVSATVHNGQYASFTTIYNPGSFSGNSIAANSTSSTLVLASNICATLIQVGASSAACAASVSGSIRYGTASNTLQICTGTGWVSLSSGTASSVAVGGVSGSLQFNNGASSLGGRSDLLIDSSGRMGVGNASPIAKPDVVGTISASDGLLTDTSDRRQKTAIHDSPDDTLERVMKLKPVSFQMKKGGSGVEYGFIAQDVEPLFPELVRDMLSLNYIGLMAPMVKAMQEMKTENDVVAAQNRQLRETLSKLVLEVKTLRKAVQGAHNRH